MAQRKTVQELNEAQRHEGELKYLRDRLRKFATDRDWNQFHTPKNLAIALSVEAGELLEHFQWTSDSAALTITDERRKRIQEEMADVLLYVIRLGDALSIDLLRAAEEKIDANATKYPVDKARGNAMKYTEL